MDLEVAALVEGYQSTASQQPGLNQPPPPPQQANISKDEVDDAAPQLADPVAVVEVAAWEFDKDVDHDVVETAAKEMLHSLALVFTCA